MLQPTMPTASVSVPSDAYDDMLANLSNIMTTALNDAGEKYNNTVESLTSCYNTVVQNRSELSRRVLRKKKARKKLSPEYDPASEEEAKE